MGKMEKSLIPFPIIEGTDNVDDYKSFITYSVCSNGIFATKKVCGKGQITTKVDGIKGLPLGKESIDILPRKIPLAYLTEAIDFFRYVKKTFKSKLEAYILLGYNYDEDEFLLYVPTQIVGPSHVKYDIESFWKDNPGYYLIADLHCHCDFGAFFSSTDNQDDNRDRFSIVIGYQDNIFPEIKLRFSNGIQHIDYNVDDLFVESKEEKVKFDKKEAIKKVNYKEVTKSVNSYDNGQTSFYNMFTSKLLEKKEFTIEELWPGW